MSNKKEAQLIIIEAFMLGTDVFFSVSAALPPLSNMCSSDRSGRGPECVCVCDVGHVGSTITKFSH